LPTNVFQNGFIYPIVKKFVSILFWLNPVEIFKHLGVKASAIILGPPSSEAGFQARYGVMIDLFVAAKWTYICIILHINSSHPAHLYIVFYLVFFNAFGYFYHHAWGHSISFNETLDRSRRRFISLIQAILFFIVAYAYIYLNQVPDAIKWPYETRTIGDALYLSVTNAFTLTYPGFEPVTRTARYIFLSELACTFTFFTVLVAASIPPLNRGQQ
jgi:hypothetical protein